MVPRMLSCMPWLAKITKWQYSDFHLLWTCCADVPTASCGNGESTARTGHVSRARGHTATIGCQIKPDKAAHPSVGLQNQQVFSPT